MVIPASVKTFFFKLHTNTLPVKTWMEERGLFVAWNNLCVLCQKPETTEHVFIDCWDAIFFWDVLMRTLKKEYPVTPYGIRFLSVNNEDDVPHDMIMLLGLYSIWRSRMAVRHADVNAQTVSAYFREKVNYLCELYEVENPDAGILPVLQKLTSFDVYNSFRQPKHGRRFLLHR